MDTARSVFQRRRKRISVWIIVFAIALTLATSLFSFFVKANGALMQDSDQVSESVNPPLAEDGVKTSDLDTGANVNNGWIALAVVAVVTLGIVILLFALIPPKNFRNE